MVLSTPSGVPRGALPTRQERSRATLEKLLDATEDMLREEGLESATVESVAARAGVSVGIVYRRFRDKDALLRSVYERFFETRAAMNARSLAPEHWKGRSAAQILERFASGAIAGASRERRLIRALNRFAAIHDDAAFRRYAQRINATTHTLLAELLLASVPTPDRRRISRRLPFAVDLFLSSLRAVAVEQNVPSGTVPPRDSLARELSLAIVRYLQLGEEEECSMKNHDPSHISRND